MEVPNQVNAGSSLVANSSGLYPRHLCWGIPYHLQDDPDVQYRAFLRKLGGDLEKLNDAYEEANESWMEVSMPLRIERSKLSALRQISTGFNAFRSHSGDELITVSSKAFSGSCG
jgi:hypothetical protein